MTHTVLVLSKVMQGVYMMIKPMDAGMRLIGAV